MDLDGRQFSVAFDKEGNAVKIVERKLAKSLYGVRASYNAIYWSAKHHGLGKRDTLPKQIIELARNAAP